MKKIFINRILLLAASLLSMNVAFAQNKIQLPTAYGVDALDLNMIDTVNFGEENNRIIIASPLDDVDKITFNVSEVDLSKPDNATTGNQLSAVSLTASANPNVIYTTVEGQKNGNEFNIFVPYLISFSNLSLSFKATGTVYCDGALQKSGASRVNFTTSKTYKVVDASGNIATYKVNVYNSGLPVVYVTTSDGASLSTNWSGDHSLVVKTSETEVNYDDNSVVLKYKGSKYSTSQKRSYSVKLDKKASVLGLSTGKRFSIYSNADDATLLRTRIAYEIASKFSDLSWTPQAVPVELVENNVHKGSYLFAEDARISAERVNAQALLEWTDEYEEDNDCFKSDKYKLIFTLEDENGMSASDANETINSFESSLAKGSGLDKIDMNSFVDWYLLHEIFKDKDAVKSAMLSIAADGKISMGPVNSQEDAIGNENESAEGYVLRNHPWFVQLFENPEFVSALYSRFEEISKEITSMSYDEYVKEISLSYKGNEELYSLKTDLEKEVSEIQSWLKKRIEWLSARLSIENETVKSLQPNDRNKILSFSIKKNANSQALLSDYNATISGDSIKIFVPYLAHFDLKPEFSLSSGAKAYALGEAQTSGSSVVNFLHPVTYRVVSQSGEVRNYIVKIYNSGINVLYINTPGNKTINSKETWIDGTSLVAYRSDGTVDYDSGSDYVQVKGRGNSTWTIEGKKPYAIKLNKKQPMYGMLEHKRWVLLANYYDVTFFRNEFSNYLSKSFTTSDWSPSGVFVELVLNGKHNGNYYFCEQVKINDKRIPGQYLVEADLKEGSGQFQGTKSGNYFNVKDPDVANGSQELQYVKDKINAFETALYDTTGSGEVNASSWSKLKEMIDLPSFADWYIIKELSKDYDGNMYTSCYCHIMEDGLIKMGPIWDFDLAWGGNPFETMMFGTGDYAWYNKPEDYYIGARQQSAGMGMFGGFGDWGGGWNTGGWNTGGWNTGGNQNVQASGPTNWFMIFFKQKEFRALVLERVNNMVDHLDEINAYIDQNTKLLTLSSESNNACTTYYSDNKRMSYAERMNIIKKFFTDRLKWIQSDLSRR
ncbi:MAG: CotH kinase family protein [Paludibacteraceae bacterium]|nr:CotH kinase family protein [Paludibacteraceae bacterium]